MLEALLGDPPGITVGKLEDHPAPHVEGKLLQLGEAGARELVRQGPRRIAEIAAEPGRKPLEETRRLGTARRRKLGTNLEPPPRGAIEQLTVVRGPHKEDVRRKTIDL